MTLPSPTAWMLGAFLGGVALHADRLFWIYVAVPVVACLWRALGEARNDVRLPPAWLRGTLALALLAGVLLQYRTVNGLGPGTALLVSMGSVKLLETRSRRDRYIMIAVALFLMLSACLDRQSMLRAPLYLLLTWACCVAFIYVSNPDLDLPAHKALSLTGRALLWSLPLAVMLFALFPRLPGQLWALPAQDSAQTGLSDEMTPGGISSLSESDEPAFRVRFEGAAPAAAQRYWRGPVLHQFDGYRWRRDRSQTYRHVPLRHDGPRWRYRITLEPHQRNWLFALESLDGPLPRASYLTHDGQLLSAQPVTQLTSYELMARGTAVADGELSVLGRRIETALPSGRNRRSMALARDLRRAAPDVDGFIGAVLRLFRDGGFTYTLTPELLQQDSVDDFIFNTKAGFCGHYASAFVAMMRAGGVPARIVTGYQGGEWNPIGGYFIVRQSDAHAWAEVWIEGSGWRRVDPTAVVAPERLTRGLLDVMPEAGTEALRLAGNFAWLQEMRMRWDAMNTWWKESVQEFDARSQLALLEKLGFAKPLLRQLGWLAAALFAGWVLMTTLWFARRARPQRRDPLARGYSSLCRRLAQHGLARSAHEGPTDFAARIATLQPKAASAAATLLREYAALRYEAAGAADRTARTRRWLRAVRRLRLAA